MTRLESKSHLPRICSICISSIPSAQERQISAAGPSQPHPCPNPRAPNPHPPPPLTHSDHRLRQPRQPQRAPERPPHGPVPDAPQPPLDGQLRRVRQPGGHREDGRVGNAPDLVAAVERRGVEARDGQERPWEAAGGKEGVADGEGCAASEEVELGVVSLDERKGGKRVRWRLGGSAGG